MSDKGGDNTTSTTTSEPWAEQKPYLIDTMKSAKELYQQPGPDYFPGSTVAPPSPGTQAYWDYVSSRGPEADKGVQQAQDLNSDFLTGKYLGSNPYNDAVYQNISSHILPSVMSSAMMAGRSGSGLSQSQAIDQLTQAYAPQASENYLRELGMMQGAQDRAGDLNQDSYFNANQMNTVGQQQKQQGQAELTDAVQRYNFYQQEPYNKLRDYIAMIQGDYGHTATTSTPTPSIWQSIIGAGLSLL